MTSEPHPDAPPGSSESPPSEGDGERPPLLSMLLMVLFPFLVVLALMVVDGWVRRGTP